MKHAPLSRPLHALRLLAVGAAIILLAACKYQDDDSPASSIPSAPSTPSAPAVPATPTAFSRAAAPQVSASGPLTLERYTDTTSAAGGTASSGQNALAHEESKP